MFFLPTGITKQFGFFSVTALITPAGILQRYYSLVLSLHLGISSKSENGLMVKFCLDGTSRIFFMAIL